jgi:hypothetical protein
VQHCTSNGHSQSCTSIFIDGTAALGDSSTTSMCELPLDGGTMRLLVEQGTAHVTAKGALDITLSGPLVRWNGTDEPSDAFVTVQFSAAAPG